MFDFHEKRKIRSILYSKPVSAVLLLGALALSFSVYDRFMVAKSIEQKLEARKEELRILEERAGALQAKVEYLEDERGIEEEIRNRFDVAKTGEQVVIIVDEPEESSKEIRYTSTTDATTLSATGEVRKGWKLLKFW